jgi:3-deoxy-7-phosphoheptulonate synthase
MIITLTATADLDSVKRALIERGQWVRGTAGEGPRQLVTEPWSQAVSVQEIQTIPGVSGVSAAKSEHPRIDAQGPSVEVSGVSIDARKPLLFSGPCCVESEERVRGIAAALGRLGVAFLRGGAFKPRTSPYAFQGHGEEALRWMRRAADDNGMRVVTEVLGEGDVAVVSEYAHLLQVGSRNMQNFSLLKAIGKAQRPVLLKRSMSATVEEWLLAAEYLLVHGATGVVFCERGIRGFDDSTRNLLDLGAVALLAHVHRLPVIVDPSHATGRRDLVLPLARAALAAGAAGVMIETHDDPASALSDGPQALPPEALTDLAKELDR